MYDVDMALIRNDKIGFDYTVLEETPVLQRCALTTGRECNNADI